MPAPQDAAGLVVVCAYVLLLLLLLLLLTRGCCYPLTAAATATRRLRRAAASSAGRRAAAGNSGSSRAGGQREARGGGGAAGLGGDLGGARGRAQCAHAALLAHDVPVFNEVVAGVGAAGVCAKGVVWVREGWWVGSKAREGTSDHGPHRPGHSPPPQPPHRDTMMFWMMYAFLWGSKLGSLLTRRIAASSCFWLMLKISSQPGR